MKYAVITRHRREFQLRLMCRVLEVAPSGYYAWRRRSPSLHALADEMLMARIARVHEESDGTYGAPRVQRELKDEGFSVGTKRVARLMRRDGIVARRRRRTRVSTTTSEHSDPIAPNLLERRFDVNGVSLNEVWVSDLTYIPTREGWLYLATILDLGSRRCVGWSMGSRIDVELALGALRMALEARRPAPGLIAHSDRGSQYASDAYRGLLEAHGAIASMSRKGDCWDNAVAESFFATLEFELVAKSDWHTREEARLAIFRYIETWYNRKRRHSTLGYVSPANYEEQVKRAA